MVFRYFAAQLYDSFVLIALFFAFTALCLFATHGDAIPPASHWYQFSLLGIFFSYYLFSIHRGGQTIGMRAWRLQITTDEGMPNYSQLIKRLLLILPALLTSLIVFRSPQQPLYRWTKTKLICQAHCSLS